MKKLTLIATLAIVALLFTSCKKDDYTKFVGTWGVEKIEYYNVDYAGNPIGASLETYNYDPNSTDNGIQLTFRSDKTGEIRDSAVDTLWTDWNQETQAYDSYIVCPDTVLVYTFSYSYDKNDHVLYMSRDFDMHTFKMSIDNLTDNSFTYQNEYSKDYMERAYLKRISNTTKSASRSVSTYPHKHHGSLLGDK